MEKFHIGSVITTSASSLIFVGLSGWIQNLVLDINKNSNTIKNIGIGITIGSSILFVIFVIMFGFRIHNQQKNNQPFKVGFLKWIFLSLALLAIGITLIVENTNQVAIINTCFTLTTFGTIVCGVGIGEIIQYNRDANSLNSNNAQPQNTNYQPITF